MKRVLFLHIGTGKTGTTALQTFCSINTTHFHRQGYHYLQSPKWGDNSHHLLGFALWGSQKLDLPNIPEVSLEEILSQIEQEVLSTSENINKFIISSELLFEIISTPKVDPLIKLINKLFDEVKIICYLRRQDNHLQSLYQQWIKTGHTKVKGKSIHEFIADYKIGMYSEKLEPWRKQFGLENILVRVYEKEQFEGGTIFSDFLYTIGLKANVDWSFPQKGKSNISISSLGVALMRICPELRYDDFVKMGFEMEQAHESNESLLSANDRKDILAKYKESNRLVALEYLNRKDGVLFRVDNINDDTKSNLSDAEKIIQQLVLQNNNLQEKINKLTDKLSVTQSTINSLTENQNYFYSFLLSSKFVFDLRKETMNSIVGRNDIESIDFKNETIMIKSCGKDPFIILAIPFNNYKNHRFHLKLDSLDPIPIQVFYREKNEQQFSEQNSITVMLGGSSGNTHTFELKNKNLDNFLRLDLGMNPGIIILSEFSIKRL